MHVLPPAFPALAPLTEERSRHPTLYIRGHHNPGWASGELHLHAGLDRNPAGVAEREGRTTVGKYGQETCVVTCLLSSVRQQDCPELDENLVSAQVLLAKSQVARWAYCRALDPARKCLGGLHSPNHFTVKSKCQFMCGVAECSGTGRTP